MDQSDLRFRGFYSLATLLLIGNDRLPHEISGMLRRVRSRRHDYEPTAPTDCRTGASTSQCGMAIQLRRIRSSEGNLLREVRLAALADSPLAFESTIDKESNRPDEQWEADAVARSEGVACTNFVAEGDTGIVGLVGAYRSDDEMGTVELVSMWVAPAARSRGLGAQLVERAVQWAISAGATRVALWVTRGNNPAITLYTRMGFVPTAEVKPHVSHSCHQELRMALDLTGRDAE